MALLISHQSKDYYQQLLDTAPEAIVVVGPSGAIELVNRRTESLFGYARGAIVGRPLDVLIPDESHVGGAAELAHSLRRPSARPTGLRLALSGRREDGTEIPIEVSFTPLATAEGTVVSAVIHDARTREDDSSAGVTSDHLASAIDGMKDALALFDREDRLVLCNAAYRRLIADVLPTPPTGERYERVLDAWLDHVELPSDEARAQFLAESSSRRANHRTSTFDLSLRDGRSLRVIDRRTADGECVETIRDVTDEVRRAEELRAARAAAEADSRAKTEFLASMSHELRTPLNAILGFAQLIQRDRQGPLERLERRVAHIVKGGEHVVRLLDDILDLSRMEAGGVAMSIQPVEVRSVVGEVESTLGPLAVEGGVCLDSSVVPADLPLVAADRTRLTQILMNFGSNGIKYNRPAGTVTFAARVIAGNRVRIAVRDDGLGIPEEKKEKLFQPFERAGRETSAIQGTGLGLVVTRRLAQLMHGDVGFASVAGCGSEFWVDLPVAASGARAQPPMLEDLGASTDGSSAPRPSAAGALRERLGSEPGTREAPGP
jgi:PAS domain S-box-containing protein